MCLPGMGALYRRLGTRLCVYLAWGGGTVSTLGYKAMCVPGMGGGHCIDAWVQGYVCTWHGGTVSTPGYETMCVHVCKFSQN